MRSWPAVAWGKGKGAAQRIKAPELVTEKDLCGLEVPELTQRSCELAWNIHGCQAFILIPMKVVNEMGKVVETSFHHINGKHGKSGRGGQTVSRKFPVMDFLVKPIPI
jgi:hypothetical protein